MTTAVVTCTPDDRITDVAKTITERRLRHLPVKQNGRLVGVISIGDVLKHRLAELQLEARVLRDIAIVAR
jgi:CBS domain-containing protein